MGKHNEYWIDPNLDYCSCKDYYYRTLSGKGLCYHLEFAKGKMTEKLETVRFSDSEYFDFVKSVMSDNYLNFRNETVGIV